MLVRSLNRQGFSVVGIHSPIRVVFLMLRIACRNFRIFGGLQLGVPSSETVGDLRDFSHKKDFRCKSGPISVFEGRLALTQG